MVWRLLLHEASASIIGAYLTTTGFTLILAWQMIRAAAPSYDSTGGLIDAGQDLSQEGGLMSYYFDVIYVTWFVHLTSAFISDKFWWCYLVVRPLLHSIKS